MKYLEAFLNRTIDQGSGGNPIGKELTKLTEPPLESFKSKNLAIRIRSSVLGEDIWLVSNETVRDNLKAEGLPVYLVEEIQHLKSLSADALRKIHMVKKIFEKSRVIESEDHK